MHQNIKKRTYTILRTTATADKGGHHGLIFPDVANKTGGGGEKPKRQEVATFSPLPKPGALAFWQLRHEVAGWGASSDELNTYLQQATGFGRSPSHSHRLPLRAFALKPDTLCCHVESRRDTISNGMLCGYVCRHHDLVYPTPKSEGQIPYHQVNSVEFEIKRRRASHH